MGTFHIGIIEDQYTYRVLLNDYIKQWAGIYNVEVNIS